LYEVPPKPISGKKSCPELMDEPDYKKYGWLYENDKHDIRANGTGVVVSNREWGYNLVDFQSLVKVGVDFKAQCTFSIDQASTVRTLKIIDDLGKCHGELTINIHSGVPCVCGEASNITVKKTIKEIRCPDPLSQITVANCSETESQIGVDYDQVIYVDLKNDGKRDYKWDPDMKEFRGKDEDGNYTVKLVGEKNNKIWRDMKSKKVHPISEGKI